jgi:hypothetical protein
MMLSEKFQHAIKRDRTIDITTTGRRSGKHHRIEIWFYLAGGRIYLSGSSGRRGWYANLLANPRFTFHLKRSVEADLPARAKPITDPGERGLIFSNILKDLHVEGELEAWVIGSPLMVVEFIQEEPTWKWPGFSERATCAFPAWAWGR